MDNMDLNNEVEIIDVDAVAKAVKVTMFKGYVMVTPPEGEGKPVDKEMIMGALAEKKIVSGIHEDIIEKIVEDRIYNEEIEIAAFTPPIQGIDGEIVMIHESKVGANTRDDGSVDFKELNIIDSVSKGEEICEIKEPTQGENGLNIFGGVLKCKDGKAAKYKLGKNVELIDNKIVSQVDGNLIIKGNDFSVSGVYTVSDDVDVSVGNINFKGDVVINGNVREGYDIFATGSVSIAGQVEGSNITAGGDIVIKVGMNGQTKGKLSSCGNIKCRYIENAKVVAKNDIYCDSIINSTVQTNGNLYANTGKGSIIGGEVVVRKNIIANQIGSKSNSPTKVCLGVSHEIIKQKDDLKEMLTQCENTIDILTKDMLYIQKTMRGDNTDQAKLLKLKENSIKLEEEKEKLINLKDKLIAARNAIENSRSGNIKAQTMYPKVTVQIGKFVKAINEEIPMASYKVVDGELKLVHYV